MKSKILFFGTISVIVLLAILILFDTKAEKVIKEDLRTIKEKIQTSTSSDQTDNQNIPLMTVIAKNLDTPWALAFLNNNSMLVTLRSGQVIKVETNGTVTPVTSLSEVKEIGEGGLLGIALHPQFAINHFVYLYYTFEGNGNNTKNRVVRYAFENNSLRENKTILDNIPGALFHNGGRIKFGPDNNLYITTGDARDPSLAQNKTSVAGKILRVTDEGKSVSDNPFGSVYTEKRSAQDKPFSNSVYSLGHRNPQGFAWDTNGNLWATEHGNSARDEVNRIEKGKNYGWPEVQGQETKPGLELPIIESGTDTWAPSGAAILNNKLYFAGLRGEALYEMDLSTKELQTHFKSELGRIREVVLGPDNMLYITTSNTDGRGNPQADDDKIIRINPF